MTAEEYIEQAVKMLAKRPVDYFGTQILCAIDGRLLIVPWHDQPPKDIRIYTFKYYRNETGPRPLCWIRLATRIRRLHKRGLLS